MIGMVDIRDEAIARPILELQKRAYTIEAELIGSDNIPPLHDTLDSLRNCNEEFSIYTHDDQIAGAISFKRIGSLLDIHRLVVSPDYFRRGIASRLLEFLEKMQDVSAIVVSTAEANLPAVALYRKHGYTMIEREEVEPGLWVVRFRKELR